MEAGGAGRGGRATVKERRPRGKLTRCCRCHREGEGGGLCAVWGGVGRGLDVVLGS